MRSAKTKTKTRKELKKKKERNRKKGGMKLLHKHSQLPPVTSTVSKMEGEAAPSPRYKGKDGFAHSRPAMVFILTSFHLDESVEGQMCWWHGLLGLAALEDKNS